MSTAETVGSKSVAVGVCAERSNVDGVAADPRRGPVTVFSRAASSMISVRSERFIPERARTSMAIRPISIRSPTERRAREISAPLTSVGFAAVEMCSMDVPDASRRIQACFREMLLSSSRITSIWPLAG